MTDTLRTALVDAMQWIDSYQDGGTMRGQEGFAAFKASAHAALAAHAAVPDPVAYAAGWRDGADAVIEAWRDVPMGYDGGGGAARSDVELTAMLTAAGTCPAPGTAGGGR